MTHGQGHKANDVFAPKGAWQSGVSADFFALGYDAFGSLLPGRNFSSSGYRFGFQRQEKDDEMHGANGTSYAFEYRMHDTRVGRFLSIDPLAAKYAYNSPYAFSENRVIDAIELEGLEKVQLATEGQAMWDGFVRATGIDKAAQAGRELGESIKGGLTSFGNWLAGDHTGNGPSAFENKYLRGSNNTQLIGISLTGPSAEGTIAHRDQMKLAPNGWDMGELDYDGLIDPLTSWTDARGRFDNKKYMHGETRNRVDMPNGFDGMARGSDPMEAKPAVQLSDASTVKSETVDRSRTIVQSFYTHDGAHNQYIKSVYGDGHREVWFHGHPQFGIAGGGGPQLMDSTWGENATWTPIK